jgi:AcrR family transcriptional regulator
VSTTASRREERRQLHQDLSRTQLLDAAEEVFGARGFHDTTLKQIAELAEFSVGSVYSFFANKDDLFLHVFLRRGEEFLPGMEAAATGGDDAVAQLHALVDFEVGFFRQHPHFGRLYLRTSSSSLPGGGIEPSEELSTNFGRAMDIQAGIFRRGQAAGALREGDPAVLGRLLTGLVAAYQSMDPAVVADPPSTDERLPLATLHQIVDRAFGPA